MDGTALLRFKRALFTRLAVRLPNVSYQSPAVPSDMYGDDGTGDCIWWTDEANSNDNVTLLNAGAKRIDETFTVTLRIQCLGRDTDATQDAVDERAVGLLGQVIAEMAHDPTVGITTDSYVQTFHALPQSWKYQAGLSDSADRRAAAFELTIEVNARLTLDLT